MDSNLGSATDPVSDLGTSRSVLPSRFDSPRRQELEVRIPFPSSGESANHRFPLGEDDG